nr:hypothetical protein [Xanthomonas arboricola]
MLANVAGDLSIKLPLSEHVVIT